MRFIDWQSRLCKEIEGARKAPFVWGSLDCCLFACNCATAICGVDPAAGYRGTYSDEKSAADALAARHGSIASAFSAYFKERDPAFVQRGDLVLFESGLGPAAGVYWAGKVWAMTKSGLQAFPPEIILQAWEIK